MMGDSRPFERQEESMAAKKGDRIVVESAQVGQPNREGLILEVIEGSIRARYRVRWSDGHESTFSPSLGSARIEPAPGKKSPQATQKKSEPAARKKSEPASRKKSQAVPKKKKKSAKA
jgi:hypothetical protein